MRKLGRQAVLNRVWKHLRKQGVRCVTVGGSCKYRGTGDNEGLKCAIGALIPDSIYSPIIEGMLISDLIGGCGNLDKDAVGAAFRNLLSPDVTANFLNDLQQVHDNCRPPEWEEKLTRFALHNDLRVLS